LLADFAANDPRIRVVTRSQNGHISAASNSALAIATGEFVALLDHDDVLAPHALSCMIERLQEGEYDLAYSDEDHIDEFGRRYEPFFKPDWNPELLHSVNYLCHLTLVRRSLVERAGGFRLGFEGAQDFDLFLRISRDLPAHRVAHVPRVLYHWRSVEGSTARSPGEKAYAESAGLAALREHVAAVDAHAVAMPGLLRTTYRVRWRLPEPTPLVSIIIPTRDRLDLLRQCLDSIRGRTVYPSYEIVIVDNESRQPETLAYLRDVQQSGNVRVLRYEGAFNFSAINNRAVAAAAGSVIALVNNDIEVIDGDWLDELVSHAVRPEIGAVGPKLLYRDRHIQHAGLVLGVHRVAGHAFKHLPGDEGGANGRAMMTQSVSALTGACLVVRKAVYELVGGLDEVHLQVAFNDVDFCIKVSKAGYRNVYTPYARLYHYESASRGIDGSAERVARFNSEVDTMLDRWGETLENDPAYNPNLTVVDEDFSLAWPPRVRE
jgi:GT2 family glycosyltransferase